MQRACNTHTHTHTHTRTYVHTHTHARSHARAHIYTLSLSLSVSLCVSLCLSLSFSQSRGEIGGEGQTDRQRTKYTTTTTNNNNNKKERALACITGGPVRQTNGRPVHAAGGVSHPRVLPSPALTVSHARREETRETPVTHPNPPFAPPR